MGIKYKYEGREEEQEIIPEGYYEVKIANAEFGLSKNGNDMLELKLSVLSVPGKIIYDVLVFTEKAMWRVDQAMAAIGIASDSDEEIELTEEMLIGKGGWVEVEITEWEGKERNKVEKWLKEAPEGAGEEPSDGPF